ncbi:MAG TPA: hypothetical protein VKI20_10330 [Acidimicrobiales bacterium]|nr:hypothetical protein [Acidimicrobiales bacterium]
MGGVGRELGALAFGPHGEAGRMHHLHLDVEVERQRQGVEPGAEVGCRGGGTGAHGAGA